MDSIFYPRRYPRPVYFIHRRCALFRVDCQRHRGMKCTATPGRNTPALLYYRYSPQSIVSVLHEWGLQANVGGNLSTLVLYCTYRLTHAIPNSFTIRSEGGARGWFDGLRKPWVNLFVPQNSWKAGESQTCRPLTSHVTHGLPRALARTPLRLAFLGCL